MIKTKSYCEKCKKGIDAKYFFEDGNVFFEKMCKKHKTEKIDLNISEKDFGEWMKKKIVNIPPKIALSKENEGKDCPMNCGTCENHLQTACCVVIDITKRCNQACPYCFANAKEEKARDTKNNEDITLNEIEKKLDFLIEIGEEIPFNLQFSGGEPTVRDDLLEIIEIAREKGFEYIQINSNGKRIAEEKGYAEKLKKAGASVVFMQFDGTSDEIYNKIRGQGLLNTKHKAIENLRNAKLPVTLVPTIIPGVNDRDIKNMLKFLIENIDIIKGVHFQPVSYFGRHPEEKKRTSMFDIIHELEKANEFIKKKDFLPIATGHPLCCFYSIYVKDGERIISQINNKNNEEGISCCETEKKEKEICGKGKKISRFDENEIIRKDRGFVINKWDVEENEENILENITSSSQIKTLDEMLAFYKMNTFTITAMPFQDVDTIDTNRLKRCRVQVLSRDNKLIPFCAYNSIYRKEEENIADK